MQLDKNATYSICFIIDWCAHYVPRQVARPCLSAGKPYRRCQFGLHSAHLSGAALCCTICLLIDHLWAPFTQRTLCIILFGCLLCFLSVCFTLKKQFCACNANYLIVWIEFAAKHTLNTWANLIYYTNFLDKQMYGCLAKLHCTRLFECTKEMSKDKLWMQPSIGTIRSSIRVESKHR